MDPGQHAERDRGDRSPERAAAGDAQLVPVDRQEIWISTPASTAKTHNLRRDPRIVLCIDDPESGDYVQIIGTATIVEGPAVREPTIALIRKYRDEPDVDPPLGDDQHAPRSA